MLSFNINRNLMGRLILIWIIVWIIYVKVQQNKRDKEDERIKAEKEAARIKQEEALKRKIKQLRKSISELNNYLVRTLRWKYLNYKRFIAIRGKYQADFNGFKPYKENFYDEYPVVFDFFQNAYFRDEHNDQYVESCKDKYSKYFIDLDEKWFWLTDKQLEAVFSDEDATLVNAGAGTWKTKTIESKLLHLVAHRHIPIEKVLVMTFSKKAQEDMMKRISKSLEKAHIPFDEDLLKNTVTTFHAFGKRILDEENMLNSTDTERGKQIGKWGKNLVVLDDIERNQILKRVFEEVKSSGVTQRLIAEFILYYSAPQVAISKFENLNEYYQYTKKTYKTLLKNWPWNVTVKSHGEVLIANFLRLNWIKVEYEPRDHYYTNDYWEKRPYRPDFYLPDHDIYIEYFWLDKNWNTAEYIANKEYRKRVEQKIKSHRLSWNTLIDIRYADLQNGEFKFLEKLGRELASHWIVLTPKNSNEIIEMEEVSWQLEWIAKILNTFLSLYKESNTTIEELKEKTAWYFDTLNFLRNRIFLEIFNRFLTIYTQILDEEGYMDFWDMIYKSIRSIENGTIKRNFTYIMVDEFQDISQARASLLQALIEKVNDCRLFCVWDDRQSIYQFTWSDTDIFFNFSQYFWHTKQITLDKTFRFNQGISDLSWWFIMMNPDQIEKVLISNDTSRKNKVVLVQKEYEDYKYFFDILDDLIAHSPDQEEIKVYLITRYTQWKYDDWFFDTLKKRQKNKDGLKDTTWETYEFNYDKKKVLVTHLTSHKSKWLEADYVIVDYVNQWDRYDFPSNFEDDPILLIITHDENNGYPFAEERRVFYVSMTRWKKKSYIVYTKWKESLFLHDLIKVNNEQSENVLVNNSNLWYIDPSLPNCPDCWWKLSKRTNTKDQKEFRGCSNYPRCEYTEDLDASESPHCPIHQRRMRIRVNWTTWDKFWWCPEYPECTYTREI